MINKEWTKTPRVKTGKHVTMNAGDEYAGYAWVSTAYRYLETAGIRKEMYEWCEQQFGPSDAQLPRRWFRHFTGKFYFRDESDLNWFVLRWS
jgi:hypothetical protein